MSSLREEILTKGYKKASIIKRHSSDSFKRELLNILKELKTDASITSEGRELTIKRWARELHIPIERPKHLRRKRTLSTSISVDIGLKCIECGVYFISANGHPVLCKSCAKFLKAKGKTLMYPISKYSEVEC